MHIYGVHSNLPSALGSRVALQQGSVGRHSLSSTCEHRLKGSTPFSHMPIRAMPALWTCTLLCQRSCAAFPIAVRTAIRMLHQDLRTYPDTRERRHRVSTAWPGHANPLKVTAGHFRARTRPPATPSEVVITCNCAPTPAVQEKGMLSRLPTTAPDCAECAAMWRRRMHVSTDLHFLLCA